MSHATPTADGHAARAALAARPGAHTVAACMAAASCGFGVLAALSMQDMLPVDGQAALPQATARLASDRALQLAAVASLAVPVLALQALTTPVHAAARRWLGEDAVSQVRTAIAETTRWLGWLLLAPLGMAATALVQGDPAYVRLRAALLMVVALTGTWAVAQMALLLALGLVARGARDSWRTLSGGGTFGPAAAAPLLYAPAAGLIGGLLPAALLSAVWGARDRAYGLTTACAAAVFVAVVAPLAVGRTLARVRRHLHHGLLAVEAAHATPFAEGRLLPPLQPWLRPAARTPAGAWLALAWSRHHPGSPWATAGMVLLAWLAGSRSGAATAWLAGWIAVHATARAEAAASGPVAAAAAWLGAGPAAWRGATARLASTLGLWGGLALLLATTAPSLPAALGVAAAVACGWSGARAALVWGPASLRNSLAQAAWAAWALGLGWAVSSH